MAVYFIKNPNISKEIRYFRRTCFWNGIFILADLTGWIFFDFARIWFPIVFVIGRFVYYAVIAIFFLTLLRYIVEYVSSLEKVSKVYMGIARVLTGVHFIGCMLTPFTGFFYEITEENRYRLGKGVIFCNILPMVVLLMIIIISVHYRKVLKPRAGVALYGYSCICFLGQVVKVLFEGVMSINPYITLATIILFFNMQYDRDVQQKLDKEKLEELNMKMMLGQIRPHFLYNTLACIRGLCEKEPAMAKKLMNDFTIFLRANMDSLTNHELIPFEQELLHIKSYLNLVQQMYGEKLEVVYEIKTTQFLIPTLSLQPLVENAVHKGIKNKKDGGKLTIQTEETEKYFQIIVSDNGTGFDRNVLKEDGHIGIKNVQKRLSVMCKGILVIDTAFGIGTTVYITIPKNITIQKVSPSSRTQGVKRG